MLPRAASEGPAILYVGSRLPELSETFVYRELLGLRARGYHLVTASVRAPRPQTSDPIIDALAKEALVIYGRGSVTSLPRALLWRPRLMAEAIIDAWQADHPSFKSRVKHVYQAAMAISAAWRLRSKPIAHVHAHMASVPAMLGYYIARANASTFSFTGHASDIFVSRAALRFKLERASFVSCISYWHRQFYREVATIDTARLPIIRCSVALPGQIEPQGYEVVTVARLVAKKGVDLLLKAFAQAALPGWTLRVVGDGPERATLEAMANALGISMQVRFDGARPHAESLAAIRRAGIFVLSCRTATNGDKDGIPVVLMEAMAAARAVIAGDLPAIRELVSHGEHGLLVPADDPTALARALVELAGDPARVLAMGLAGREHVRAEFSDAVNLDRLESAFLHARVTQ